MSDHMNSAQTPEGNLGHEPQQASWQEARADQGASNPQAQPVSGGFAQTQAPSTPGERAQAQAQSVPGAAAQTWAQPAPGAATQAQAQAIPGAAAQTQVRPTSGLAIAGMVLGIIALLTLFVPVINFGSPVLGIVGLILSVVGYSGVKKGAKSGKGIAVAGIVLCAIVTVIALLVSAACSAAISSRDSGSASAPAATASASAPATTASAAATSTNATSASGKPSKDGFNKSTCTKKEVAGVRFLIPDYFGEPNGATYAIEDKTAFMVTPSSELASGSEDKFKQAEADFVNVMLDSLFKDDLEYEIIEVNDAQLDRVAAAEFTASMRRDSALADAKGVIFFNDDASSLGCLLLVQADAAKYDYFSDFDKIVASAKLVEADSKHNASASSASSADSGEVNPDLKEMLDSYEAFMDEYVDFMKRYQESGDITGMLQEYTDYMARYTDFMQKVDKLDTSDMSAADYAYYIDVTSRVSKKLLEVSVM